MFSPQVGGGGGRGEGGGGGWVGDLGVGLTWDIYVYVWGGG